MRNIVQNSFMENTQPPIASGSQTSGIAIASLVAGLTCIAPLAIILGHIAMSRINKSAGQLTGFGMALAGTILGYVGLVMLLILPFFSILFVGARAWKEGSDRAACIIQTRNMQQAVRGYQNMKSLKVGDPLDWGVIFGSGKYIENKPNCPLGGTYTFTDTIPPLGTLAGQCSHEGHVPPEHNDW